MRIDKQNCLTIFVRSSSPVEVAETAVVGQPNCRDVVASALLTIGKCIRIVLCMWESKVRFFIVCIFQCSTSNTQRSDGIKIEKKNLVYLGGMTDRRFKVEYAEKLRGHPIEFYTPETVGFSPKDLQLRAQKYKCLNASRFILYTIRNNTRDMEAMIELANIIPTYYKKLTIVLEDFVPGTIMDRKDRLSLAESNELNKGKMTLYEMASRKKIKIIKDEKVAMLWIIFCCTNENWNLRDPYFNLHDIRHPTYSLNVTTQRVKIVNQTTLHILSSEVQCAVTSYNIMKFLALEDNYKWWNRPKTFVILVDMTLEINRVSKMQWCAHLMNIFSKNMIVIQGNLKSISTQRQQAYRKIFLLCVAHNVTTVEAYIDVAGAILGMENLMSNQNGENEVIQIW